MSNATIERNTHVKANAPIAGVYDAQAFTVGNSDIVHEPAHYPTANMVVAKCGVYAYAVERDSRIAHWADAEVDCANCNA